MLTAILFDLDGTIVNTDPVHYQAWREMLLNYGIEIDETFYKTRISGRLNPEIVKDILPQLSPEAGALFADQKEALFRQKASYLKPLNGFSELLAWTQKYHIKRALVTNAPRLNAEFMLEVLEIEEIFDTVVLAEDCIAGKPDPAPYEAALVRYNSCTSDRLRRLTLWNSFCCKRQTPYHWRCFHPRSASATAKWSVYGYSRFYGLTNAGISQFFFACLKLSQR